MLHSPIAGNATLPQLPSTTKQATHVTRAWKKLLLDICAEHLNNSPIPSPSKHSHATNQLPSSDSVHLLDTDQLWQSLEFQNKAVLPATKRRLRALLPRKRPIPHHVDDPHVEDRLADDDGSSVTEPSVDHDINNEGVNVSGKDLSPDMVEGAQPGDASLNENKLKQRRLIEALEEKNIAPKSWALRGEVSASARPKNSLLGSVLEHDTVRKPDMLLTEDINGAIEDMIKRRIADARYDDVVPKQLSKDVKPGDDNVLDELSEKPRKGLGELYEEAYRESERREELQNVAGVPRNRVSKEVEEVYAAFECVSRKIDALSSMSFTPIVNEVVNTAAEAVPEDLVKDHAMVTAPEAGDSKERGQRKKKRRQGDKSRV